MKTPWINYDEMKRVGIIRQTTFLFTGAQEQYKFSPDDCKNEVSTDHHELDTTLSGAYTDEIKNPHDNSAKNHIPDLHRKNGEFKEMDVSQVVKEIKKNQTNPTGNIRDLPIDWFTAADHFNEMTDSANVNQAHQNDLTRETDNDLQKESKFNIEHISESDTAPSYIESVITVNALKGSDITRTLEPSGKRDKSIKFGISQLVNVLKKLQIIPADEPFEISIDHHLPVIDEATGIDHVTDSQTECETVDTSISDVPVSYIELDKSNEPLESIGNIGVIKLDEENSESKQMGINRLVNTLKRVQIISTDEPFELSIDHHLPVIDEAIGIDHVTDSQTECEDVDISISDAPLSYIELDKSNDSLESTGNIGVIKLDEENSESKQMGINQLVNTLKRVQTIPADEPFEISIEHHLSVIDEAVEIDHVIDSQTECETVDITLTDAPLSYKSNDLLEDFGNPEVIKLDEGNSESKQMDINRLVNTLKRVQTIPTDEPLDLSIDHHLPVIVEAAEIDHVIDSQTECETMHISVTDAALSYKSNDFLEDFDNPGVIKLDEGNSESKQMCINRLVNTLKKVQTIPTDEPLAFLTNLDLPAIDEAVEIERVIDSQTECEFEPVLTSESRNTGYANEKIDRHEATDEMDGYPQCGEIYCKTINIPFSTFIEIDDFLHAPLFGEISQNTFEFLDPSNTQNFQLDTKFISSSSYYPEQPTCHLVSSAIHEIIYLTKTPHTNEPKKHKNNSSKSIIIPIHPSVKTGESNHANCPTDFIKIKVPVVVGEYNIEICIEEEVLFEEEVISIKEISKNVLLTNCRFIPTQFSKPLGDGTCAASNGMLSIEGFIVQNIEYTAMPNKNKSSIQGTEVINLHEKIILELMVQLLQEQGIRVNYNDSKNYKNG
ncbi:BC_2427 family protein [Sporosarcina sp. NPDC096371]|uniref:BC_2427 family protein n=1 Tax=Sporosarcina sp. NPDC096371 TaxID=3364530 RepID=UPI0038226C98